MRPKAIDLFCGAGGMSLGFEQAGFDIILGVDKDPYHCATHERNFPYGKTICASVTSLDGNKIKEICEIDDDIDLIFGGPPCQGFSTMGKRDSEDLRNTLVGDFVRIITELKPKAFVMENVPGMAHGSTKKYFDFILDTLSKNNYNITLPVQTLTATEFGVPQKRERLFVIGLRKEFGKIIFYPDKEDIVSYSAINVRDALDNLPEIYDNEFFYKNDYVDFKPRENNNFSEYSNYLSGIKEDTDDLSYKRKSISGLLFGNKISKHSKSSIELYSSTKPGSMVPGHKLPRLDFNGIAPTLRAGTDVERGSHTAPRPIHPLYNRCITVREAARLHGYPDWFAFYPVVQHGFRQVGNSVSPFVARAVGKKVICSILKKNNLKKPDNLILLEDVFTLPVSEKIWHKRISHLDEFPKVINDLFNKYYDFKKSSENQDVISFSKIKQSIIDTGAIMPRIRIENFVSEFSKGRNLKQIMSLPLSHSVSLIECDNGIKFVPDYMDNTITAEKSISFNSHDIKSAEKLKTKIKFEFENIIEMVSKKYSYPNITFEVDLLGKLVGTVPVGTYTKNNNLVKIAYWKSPKGSIIQFNKVIKIINEHSVDEVIVWNKLTENHLGIVIFEYKNQKLKLKNKVVFQS